MEGLINVRKRAHPHDNLCVFSPPPLSLSLSFLSRVVEQCQNQFEDDGAYYAQNKWAIEFE